MERLLHDIRYALRLLRKSPGFALAAILTLALGMSANTVMFGVLNTVLLRPLPYPQPEQLVQVWETDSRLGETHGTVSPYNFIDWQTQSRSFAEMAAYHYGSFVLTGKKVPVRVIGLLVTASFFGVFKVSPLKGRTFLAHEDEPGKAPAVVVSYGAWLRHFGGDPGIVGKSILLDDQAYTVVGIMPSNFSFPHEGVEFWCTPGFELKEFGRGSHFAFAVGRMKPGINIQQAQAEMSTIADGLNATYRKTGSGVRLVLLQEEIVGNAKRGLLVLWAAVLAVLVIASANVAGLLLARAVSRHKEVAIRSALGGSRSRLIQQFLTESVLLALIGGSVGVALSYSAGRFLVSTSSGAVPRLRELQIDGWVLTFTAAACVVTGLAFGLAPAVNALRVDLNVSLKEGGQRVGSHRLGLRSILVVVELALAMVLLIAGGLLTKTLWRLQHVDAGFQPENLLSFRFAVVGTRFPTSAQKGGLYERISERLSELPGVESVGATNDLPFAGSRSSSSFDIEGRPPDPAMVLQADYRTVSPGYFRAMRMRLRAGRGFTVHDNQDGVYAAIVNQSFVMKFFPREEPLGHRLRSHDKLYQIVGVVTDVKHENLAAPGFPEIYLPYLQADLPPSIFFVVRSHTDAQALSPAVRNAVNEVAPGQPIYSLNTMAHRIEFWMAPQKLNGLLLSVFAGLALVLAAIGIYGLIAYSVAQRTHEIGIRIALGASRRDVLSLILRQGATMGIQGLAVGTAVAYLGTRALSSMLFGVEPHDPLIFFGVAASLILTVIVASYVPARKAARVDPLVAIRYE